MNHMLFSTLSLNSIPSFSYGCPDVPHLWGNEKVNEMAKQAAHLPSVDSNILPTSLISLISLIILFATPYGFCIGYNSQPTTISSPTYMKNTPISWPCSYHPIRREETIDHTSITYPTLPSPSCHHWDLYVTLSVEYFFHSSQTHHSIEICFPSVTVNSMP